MIEDRVVHARLAYIARLFDDPPAFGLPIFSDIFGSAIYLIQEIASDGTINAFVPVDVSGLSLHAVDKPIDRKIGNKALLAFEAVKDAFNIGERASLKSVLRQFLTDQILRDHPFTRAAVANFCEESAAAWAADLDAVERLANAAETQAYYRTSILARERIISELSSEGPPLSLRSFRIRETNGTLYVELPECTTEDQFIRMESALTRCARDLKILIRKQNFRWHVTTKRSNDALNMEKSERYAGRLPDPPKEKNFRAHLEWHLFENGTRPNGRPWKLSEPWNKKDFAAAVQQARGARYLQKYKGELTGGNARRSLDTWLRGGQCRDSPWGLAVENALFGKAGENRAYDEWRHQFRAARRARPQEGHRSELYIPEPIPDRIRNATEAQIAADLLQHGWRLDRMERGQGCTKPAFNLELIVKPPFIRLQPLQRRWAAYERYPDDLRTFALAKVRENPQIFSTTGR